MKNALVADVAVVGAGPAGLAAALALARPGLNVVAIGAPPPATDRRTAALFAGSVTLLDNLGVGGALRADGAAIEAIRVIDDTGGLWRAPEVLFTAAEVGLERFGFNVPNAALVAALRQRSRDMPTLTLIDRSVAGVAAGADNVVITLDDGRQISAPLVVGADGRQSICRQAAGIAVRSWSYPQSAVVCTFAHQRDHQGISTEFHRPAGPFTVVPSPGRQSSLVWVEETETARRLAGLEEAAFRAALEERLQGLLGSVGAIGQRGSFPLSGLKATTVGQSRIALVGEAAHVIPPIGAQGLNLGLRDVACLADALEDASRLGADLGAPATLQAYDAARGRDIGSRVWAVDALNRSLLWSNPPVQALRGLGLHLLNAVGPLRRRAIREGLASSFASPRLMQAPSPGARAAGLDGMDAPRHDRPDAIASSETLAGQ